MRTARIGALLVPLLLTAQVEPPRTINGVVLGEAEDFAPPGPATVCVRDAVLTVGEGKTAYLEYSGTHALSIRLDLADGKNLVVSYRDNWADRRRSDQAPARVKGKLRFFSIEQGRDVSCQATAPSDWYDGRQRPLLHVSGSALAGNRSDRRWLKAIALGSEEQTCTRRFNYGLDVILGEQTLQAEPIN